MPVGKSLTIAAQNCFADPSNDLSQPCIKLSARPALIDGRLELRQVDLRLFAVTGSST
ncbi:MAG: hypothetical protein J2P48_06105 [Alphaproteobacteria bacterium]|nr:hypothetical protein [Alphaproteobacteria bacterium]